MKTIISMITVIILTVFSVEGQTYIDTESTEDVVVDNQVLEMFGSLGINNTDPTNLNIQGNTVFLQQIGQLNQASVTVRSNLSDINLRQEGSNNTIGLNYDVNQVYTSILQDGDNNIATDYAIAPNQDVFLDLEQNGNNLQFEREGVNSITNSLQFKQSAASPKIIVRSITNSIYIPNN